MSRFPSSLGQRLLSINWWRSISVGAGTTCATFLDSCVLVVNKACPIYFWIEFHYYSRSPLSFRVAVQKNLLEPVDQDAIKARLCSHWSVSKCLVPVFWNIEIQLVGILLGCLMPLQASCALLLLHFGLHDGILFDHFYALPRLIYVEYSFVVPFCTVIRNVIFGK